MTDQEHGSDPMSPALRALFPPPDVDDAFVSAVVAARDQQRSRRGLYVALAVAGLLLAMGTLTVRLIVVVPTGSHASAAPIDSGPRLALVAAQPGQPVRQLKSGDSLAPGEGLVPAVAVFARDVDHVILVAAVDAAGSVTWLSPHDGRCPAPGRAVGVSAEGAPAALPQSDRAFDVVLVRAKQCDAGLLAAPRLPHDVDVIDRVSLSGPPR